MAAATTTYQRQDDGNIFTIIVSNTGFVDKTGEVVIPLIYDGVHGAEVVNDIGGLGDVITTKKEFSEGLASVCVNGKFGFIDKQGNVVVPFQTEIIGAFSEGLATVGLSRYHYIDKTGADVIPMTANQYGTSAFSGGVAVAYDKKSGMYSIIKNRFLPAKYPLQYPLRRLIPPCPSLTCLLASGMLTP